MPGAWLKPEGTAAGSETTGGPLLSTRGAVLSGIATGEVAASVAAGGVVVSVVWAIAAVLIRSAAANNAVFILILLAAALGGGAVTSRPAVWPWRSMEVKRPSFSFSPSP